MKIYKAGDRIKILPKKTVPHRYRNQIGTVLVFDEHSARVVFDDKEEFRGARYNFYLDELTPLVENTLTPEEWFESKVNDAHTN